MNYTELKLYCENHSAHSRRVLDAFLINFAAEKEKMIPQMESLLKNYRRVINELQVSYVNIMKSQYIAYRIFRENGLIRSYLQLPELKKLPSDQYKFLELLGNQPWRFSFAVIISNPADNFFEMEDAMTGEVYTLYSPGMQVTKSELNPRLWLNLISFNGTCWQTFGLIIPFISFTTDDIFFFATELNPLIEDETSLMNEISKKPFPFLMLLCGANFPVVITRNFEILNCCSTDTLAFFPIEDYRNDFIIEWNKDIFRFQSKSVGDHPHFATAYYNEKTKTLTRTAMTEHGFAALTKELLKTKININEDADLVVSPAMVTAAGKILNKKIQLYKYDKLFQKKENAPVSGKLDKINQFLKLALPFYNAGKEININELAQKADIDPATAASVWESVKKNTDEMKNKST